MFRHVVMFKWAEDVDTAHVEAVAAGLDALPAQIPGIQAFAHGPDARVNDGNYDYVVVGDFASVDDYLEYRDHPAHQAFIADLVVGRVVDRAAVQFES
jgi:hypothetical protein